MNKLSKIISAKSYRQFKGTEWPSYNDFIEQKYSVTESIDKEIREFINMMEENYDNVAAKKTDILSKANQKRQNQIFYNKNYLGNHCKIAWQTLGINANGNAFICQSPSWIPIFVGNIFDVKNIFEILNSKIALQIRQEILQGRYFYCNSNICNFFDYVDTSLYNSNKTDDQKPTEFVDSENLYVNEIPHELVFDFDYTCNFKCPSCRNEYQNWNNHHIIRPINNRIVEKIKTYIIDKIKNQPIVIRWCGGEPFMSEVYIELLEYIISTKKLNIQNVIQTNGSLFLAKQDLLLRLLPYISDIIISFDAGTESTYKLTRVGGQWENLITNVQSLTKLIKEKNFQTNVSADFVVQKNNYKDLPQYAQLCRQLGIGINAPQKMWNWGSWDSDTFNDMNVYNPNHELYNDVRQYFELANLPMAVN